MKSKLKIILLILVIKMIESGRVKTQLKEKSKSKKSKNRNKQYYVESVLNQPVSMEDQVHQITQSTRAGSDCPCGSPECPPCILAKTERNIHERAQKDAQADEKTQDALMKEAELQQRLFGLANKYALQVSQYEEKARNLTLELQKVSSLAETARSKMLKAEGQAKQLALKTIHTMTVYPPHQSTHTPELAITNAGYQQTMIKEYIPQYQIKIGSTDQSGYIDPIHDDINMDIADSYKAQGNFLDHHEHSNNYNRPLSTVQSAPSNTQTQSKTF